MTEFWFLLAFLTIGTALVYLGSEYVLGYYTSYAGPALRRAASVLGISFALALTGFAWLNSDIGELGVKIGTVLLFTVIVIAIGLVHRILRRDHPSV